MLSYTQLRTTYGQLSNATDSDNLSFGTTLMNEYIRQVCSSYPWDFLEKTTTVSTVDGTQFYSLPHDYQKLITCSVTIGTTQYVPIEAPNRKFWDELNSSTGVESSYPEYFFIFNGQIGLWPIPSASTSNALTIVYRRNLVDLNVADYTTGTVAITTVTAAVTGSGTTFTTPMAGRYLRVTRTDVAASTGDHFWYEISSVSSATALTLTKSYQGTTTTGAAFTIGQMPILPEAYHMLPVYHACTVYFSTKNVDGNRAEKFKQLHDELYTQMKKDHGRKSSGVVVLDGYQRINQNLLPTDLS